MSDEIKKTETAQREEATLAFWQKENIFQKSLEKKSPQGEFVFYEGPPTANAKPALHHLESRAFKDVVPRYKTMRGYHVRRRAGWDTHGLPVELQIEKELGFSGKPDIEKYGVEAFNERCRESVYTYIGEWERFTERIGYWVDKDAAYYTLDAPYMESVWHIFKHIHNEGRLYKDYKVLPWCTRCGTALSSHELAQGYEEVKDLSITAKFRLLHPEEVGERQPTFILAWTTTPWTLPGNVALAVGADIEYVKIRNENETLIVARARAEALGLDASGAESVQGQTLVGQRYEPLFSVEKIKEHTGKKWQVVGADFVTVEDGTGVVHTAVMYGEDDFNLGTQEGLPKVHVVNPEGKYEVGIDYLEGRFVRDEEVAIDILKDLTARGLVFSKEKYEHAYPFCWRCKSPLIYYARDSWYFRMSDLRETMQKENNKVNWEPTHIKKGRFGEWIANAKDWAISRERYWGTPLPVWETKDGSEQMVIGSVDELKKHTKKSGNTYFVMRHGQAHHNVSNIVDVGSAENNLTDTGVIQAKESAKKINDIDLIIASPIPRAKQTAELVAKEIGYDYKKIVFDERIKEINSGVLNGKTTKDFHDFFENSYETMFSKVPEGGENLSGMRVRIGEFIYDIENKYQDKKILIVGHEYVAWMLDAVAGGLTQKEIIKLKENKPEYYETGEVRPYIFVPLPHNKHYELDLHRPYIDEVTLVSSSGNDMHRVREVMDVWLDSGSMPFAQDHYPFENKQWVDGPGYPADFISEAIDQTRGWFYTLLAVSALMGRGAPYKNVISLGHLLDGEGKKMSKSKGNIINPWEAMGEWGVDTLRFWMYSVNAPGDSKSFDEKTVREASRSLSWFENSARFLEMFKNTTRTPGDKQVIDLWMQERVHETIEKMTSALDRYEIGEAARTLSELFEDISQWYVRRIRDRARGGDGAALDTLTYTLRTSAQLLAPFAPFLAEDVFQSVREESDPQSVHLAEWPRTKSENFFTNLFSGSRSTNELLIDMKETRDTISSALKVRQVSGIKVRQPLQTLTLKNEALKNKDAFLELIQDEVNIKDIVFDASLEEDVVLDTHITPELKEEGDVRELIRTIQGLRKDAELSPQDTAVFVYDGDGVLLQKHWPEISKTTNLSGFEKVNDGNESHVKKS